MKAAIDLAHALRLTVVAEGIEDSETLEFLQKAGCDEAQGYIIAKPMPLHELNDFLVCRASKQIDRQLQRQARLWPQMGK
jgi:EAL domain-containing protein (putative c-di-GMP-specific phosphodiesterase class I)